MPVLGKVGLVNKGTYNASTAYTALDFVKYNGSTYVALRGVQGIAPSDDGTNWAYLAQGVDVAVANSQTVTTPGTALDAVQANRNVSGTLAKEVFDELGSLNDRLANIYNYVTVLPLGNYSQVGQTATFSLDVTKAKMVRVQCGWNSEANNSGTHYDYYPAIDTAAVYCATYIVRAQLQYVVFSFPTKNSIKIIASSNTDIGIRRVDAVF